MSEQQPDRPEGYDGELVLHFSSGDFLMTRHNGTIYTFWGELATRDHVFLVTDEGNPDDDTVRGTYIFNWSAVYEALTDHMIEHQYPAKLNQLSVPNCDENAFQTALNQLEGKLDDDELNEWLNDGR